MEQQGRRMVREHLTDQHQQFVAQLACNSVFWWITIVLGLRFW
jgi:hypothetical protein